MMINSRTLSSVRTHSTSSYGTATPSNTRADHAGAVDTPSCSGAARSCIRAGRYHDMPERLRTELSRSTPLLAPDTPGRGGTSEDAVAGSNTLASKTISAAIVAGGVGGSAAVDCKLSADPNAFLTTART
eukprot:scaffold20153_cov63-Phaeocystis_antarctica.AAC.3